ncbi:hypothetical protein BDR26DRAFT_920271 [Obelidium mucronatum]|nr:hypothetical protein BDR26DRAFT_920271 [Obelidium mucronatum]
MFCFLTTSSCTVGYIAWWLTLSNANTTIISQIHQLVATQMQGYIEQTASSLQAVASIQASMFEKNAWSFLPDRVNATLSAMHHLLQGMRQTTIDMYIYTYPEGYILGYYYPPAQSDRTLTMWTESNYTIYTYLCDINGVQIGEPTSEYYAPGDGTVENPGNNNTLTLMPGGFTGANLDFRNLSARAMSGIYIWNGDLYKSAFQVAKNPVTQEVVVFGNDWTVGFISLQMKNLVSPIPYPMWTFLLEISTGYMIASSEKNDFTMADGSSPMTLRQSSNAFLVEFARFLNSSYSTNSDLSSQLTAVMNDALGQSRISFSSNLNGKTLSGAVTVVDIGDNHPMLFIQFLDVDSVMKSVKQLANRTGLWISLVILGFVVVGTAFSYVISRQLSIVSKQIQMLKKLKFTDVLDKKAGIKQSSFIWELYELQHSFYAMVQVLAGIIKRNATLAAKPGHGGRASISTRSHGENTHSFDGKPSESAPATPSLARFSIASPSSNRILELEAIKAAPVRKDA